MTMVQVALRRCRAFFPARGFVGATLLAGVWILVLLTAGCSGRVPEEPAFSPAEAAQQALAEYDMSKDGILDAKELERCPALQGLLSDLDSKEDKGGQHKKGLLQAGEIQSRLEAFQARHVALMGVSCLVFLDGEPLVGATVTLVPESFLGPSFKTARGVSDSHGSVKLVTEGYDYPGIAPGYYRIEVSKKDAADREALPDRYNTHTTLGKEVSPLARGGVVIRLDLSSS
jgi:hypothetical protein